MSYYGKALEEKLQNRLPEIRLVLAAAIVIMCTPGEGVTADDEEEQFATASEGLHS